MVAGGVALVEKWDELEVKWGHRLRTSKAQAFHSKEFYGRDGDFAGWSDFKRKRFADALRKILRETVYFDCAVAVEDAAHSQVKLDMRGIKGFKADSHYGMAFRIARFHICKVIAEKHPGSRVQFIVEDGPWAADASVIYQSIVKTAGHPRQASNAHMLAGFASLPKGALKSLEAADFLAGRALADLDAGNRDARKTRHFIVADAEYLKKFYDGMIQAKEKRREHARRRRDGEG